MTHAARDDDRLALGQPYLLPTVSIRTPTGGPSPRRPRRPRRRTVVVVAVAALIGVGAMIAPAGGESPPAGPANAAPVAGPTRHDYGAEPLIPASEPTVDPTVTATASAPTTPAGTAPGPSTPRPGTTAPSPAGNPNPAAVAPPAPVATFAGLTGEDCGQTSTQGYYRDGWSTDWYIKSGGLATNGCSGRSVHVPMSGSTTADDLDNVIVWWFKTTGVTHGTCALSVYVPGTGTKLDSAGAPAYYRVFGSTSISGSPIGSFTVNQTAHQGAWVSGGSFPVTQGQLAVRLMTRGIDWGTGREGAHLGVSALKAQCRAT